MAFISDKIINRVIIRLLSNKSFGRKKATESKGEHLPALGEVFNSWMLDKLIGTRTCILLEALYMAIKLLIDPTEFKASSGG